ncbi:MAG: UDP-N-acetylmuramate:L-alanyl-gamma-D-glutamyl-meso-diaminopimelate ligase [Cycloclasticus pugetii]|uniref:UDP-N-acetylmuramate--L-alanyl-gamma-D-glutamyl-meso-2,6-diaminoheptandioate ligase n=1 Tax=Cycloclasticus zancles 78-ME TaxID=1198232 RepID=S5T5T8_9GAMM|nr:MULTISPECIES: UDP-N-acetylmuramate:L-alanyl-gamma-D-glutamyl-meso-diaminopimelate ligase [Cycloclasticus]AFT67909.1 udp-n-acetylmuramate:l-alanyl-gamma-d-glutamyl-meso- diaminopimelate ligase transmembrane protein [Cycloclasticus sp. P1]AGS38919.1 UDP-N-acetylmuramate:L-alanyl-gamma-D-glutamyl-meso-diaminopimelate ligase [Cycloclasticus zancles 78-ME]MBV1899165.1 UDP-N-acetylmuramate:L-alanyl-gamma-D-glutamyl-meso-diaminopimelate ligase [Cycloclasticus sp.]MDF1828947.1 UDP-N-acetylmuramate:L
MRVHILGICGTFMGGLAVMAKRLGHTVTGSDAGVYPPMSTQLEAEGIELMQGYSADNLRVKPDIVVIGNALSRGNEEVEAVLNLNLPYTSGAQWLAEHVLQHHWVLAVAGTHGKTTTSSMLAWILEDAGLKPGFLIGGVPLNFAISAKLGESDYFVIEADEYDTAFFDKRSKFVHYRPKTCILNNLEFDHADIFDDLGAIKRQFHHLVRTVPNNGLLISPSGDENLDEVLIQGCWSPVEKFAKQSSAKATWFADNLDAGEGEFDVYYQGDFMGRVCWSLSGQHNVSNALAAIAGAAHVGVKPATAIKALARFQNVKRRMEVRAVVNNITLYDDFAHHPTAIASTLAGLRGKVADQRIIAVLEPRSNTMKMGVHKETLLPSLEQADLAFVFMPDEMDWQMEMGNYPNIRLFKTIDDLVAAIVSVVQSNDHVLFMSNGSFSGIHQIIEDRLNS